MNEDEGFTIVDEYLGVREASDGSDDEPVSQVEATSRKTSSYSRGLPPSSSRYSNSIRRPTTAPIDIPASRRKLGLNLPAGWTSDEERKEGLVEVPGADPDELNKISTKLNNDGEAAQVPCVPTGDNEISSPNDNYPCANDLQSSMPSVSRPLEHLRGLTHTADARPKNADAGEECKPSATITEAGMTNATASKVSVATWPTADQQLPDTSGCLNGAETPGALHSSMTKALTVRLVPGDCAFVAILPVEGASVSDLESEMQLKLGLNQGVHLTSVQVHTAAGAKRVSLPNAPDGCTVTARPVDCVLLRARVCQEAKTSENTLGTASTAMAPAASSHGGKFVQVLLRSTWSEVIDAVKIELGVPANRRVEARRLMTQSADHEAQSRSVCSLVNGDVVELSVVDDDAWFEAGDNLGIGERKPSGAKEPSKEAITVPSPVAARHQPMPEALGKSSNSTPYRNDDWIRSPRIELPVSGNARSGTRLCGGVSSSPAARARATRSVFDPIISAADSGGGAMASSASSRSTSRAPASSVKVDPWNPQKPPEQLKAGRSIILTAANADDEGAVAELVGMGFDRHHVVKALRECGRGGCWKEAAISLLLEPQMSGVEASEVDPEVGLKRHIGPRSQRSIGPVSPCGCPICLSDIPAGEMFTVDCKDQHAFCVDCMYQHCTVQLLDSGVIPACPLSNTTCGHELGQEEVERVFLLKTYSAAHYEMAAVGSIGRDAAAQMEKDQRALETCRTLLTRRGLQSTGAVPCVNAQCGNWMVPEESGKRVRCSACLIDFCRSCKRSPYHYAADCQDVIRLTREWSRWLTEGKAAFLRVMSAQDEQHRSMLRQHQDRKREHDRAVQEAERLRVEYDKMEDWKERMCRLCPSCGRTIEKISGCDIMFCGRDAHGGNVQNGCGARFDWSKAPRYVGDRGVRKDAPFTEREPEAAARSRHFIAPEIPMRCDRCHRDVVGPLFRCIHCPSFVCCLECQDMACRDPRHVHHIFQVMDAEERGASPVSPEASSTSAFWSIPEGRESGPYDMDVDDAV